MGEDHQSFIGAGWVVLALRMAPKRLRRVLALWVVSLSPHYFYREFRPEYKDLSLGRFLEAEFARNRSSRGIICDQLLMRFIKPHDEIMDIGCGPGFVAKAVAQHVKRVYACDISRGVLECARIVNGSDNITYLYSGETGFAQIQDLSLDIVYSIAVIQHVRESIIEYLLSVVGRKLKSGGLCLFQVQLEDNKWKKESEQVQDATLAGRARLKYGLNFFPRTEGFFKEASSQAGLSLVGFHNLSDYFASPFDDIYYQKLLILKKL